MASIGDNFKDIFLAGVGAVALTGEKTKEVVDQLIAKGELTVDQGKQINSELRHKAERVADGMRYDVVETAMSTMTPEQRREFAAKVSDMAAKANAESVGDASHVKTCSSDQDGKTSCHTSDV